MAKVKKEGFTINADPEFIKAAFKGVKRSELDQAVELAAITVLRDLRLVVDAKAELRIALDMYHTIAHGVKQHADDSQLRELRKLRDNLINLFDKHGRG